MFGKGARLNACFGVLPSNYYSFVFSVKSATRYINAGRPIVRPCHYFFINPVAAFSRLIAGAPDIRVLKIHFRPYKLATFYGPPLSRFAGREVDYGSLALLFASSFTRSLYRTRALRRRVYLVRQFLVRHLGSGCRVSPRVPFTIRRVGHSGKHLPVLRLVSRVYVYRHRFRHGFGTCANCAPGRCD